MKSLYLIFCVVVLQSCYGVAKDTWLPGEMICSVAARKPCNSFGVDSLMPNDSVCFYLDWSKHYGDKGMDDCIRARVVSVNDSAIFLTGRKITAAASPYMRLVSSWVWELKRSEILSLYRVHFASDSIILLQND